MNDTTSSNQLRLFQRIAWRLQTQAEGDLRERGSPPRTVAEDPDNRVQPWIAAAEVRLTGM